MIPIRGSILAWGTVALTVTTAIYNGWEETLPVLAAEGGMLAWLYRGRARNVWLKYRAASIQRELGTRGRARSDAEDAPYVPLTADEEEAVKRLIAAQGSERLAMKTKATDLN